MAGDTWSCFCTTLYTKLRKGLSSFEENCAWGCHSVSISPVVILVALEETKLSIQRHQILKEFYRAVFLRKSCVLRYNSLQPSASIFLHEVLVRAPYYKILSVQRPKATWFANLCILPIGILVTSKGLCLESVCSSILEDSTPFHGLLPLSRCSASADHPSTYQTIPVLTRPGLPYMWFS